MSSAEGPRGPIDQEPGQTPLGPGGSIERDLFESLVHHLIEKGVLTKNDALSVVQTVAEVKRGEIEAGRSQSGSIERDLVSLERIYSSFQLVTEPPVVRQVLDGDNVFRLRPPLHDDDPKFPRDS